MWIFFSKDIERFQITDKLYFSTPYMKYKRNIICVFKIHTHIFASPWPCPHLLLLSDNLCWTHTKLNTFNREEFYQMIQISGNCGQERDTMYYFTCLKHIWKAATFKGCDTHIEFDKLSNLFKIYRLMMEIAENCKFWARNSYFYC